MVDFFRLIIFYAHNNYHNIVGDEISEHVTYTFSSRGGAAQVVEGTTPCSVQTHELAVMSKPTNQIIPCVFPSNSLLWLSHELLRVH